MLPAPHHQCSERHQHDDQQRCEYDLKAVEGHLKNAVLIMTRREFFHQLLRHQPADQNTATQHQQLQQEIRTIELDPQVNPERICHHRTHWEAAGPSATASAR